MLQLYVFVGRIGGYSLHEHVEAVKSGGGSQASGACVNQAQVTGKLDLCCRGLGWRTCIITNVFRTLSRSVLCQYKCWRSLPNCLLISVDDIVMPKALLRCSHRQGGRAPEETLQHAAGETPRVVWTLSNEVFRW